ncbi:MAG: DUF177 domain-containing protein [Caldisericota bacterium]|jgi:uncharacterized protein|nr:DUF177 domain-containing protein [Caldisericota bacterium]
MKLELKKLNLEEGETGTFEFLEDTVGELGDIQLLQPVQGEFTLANVGLGYRMAGGFRTRVRQPCARCLDPVDSDLEVEVDETYLTEGQEPDQEDIFVLDSGSLDVSDVVRQNLLMGIDRFALCNEDCRGLCIVCGANLNHTACAHGLSEKEK